MYNNTFDRYIQPLLKNARIESGYEEEIANSEPTPKMRSQLIQRERAFN